MRKKKSDRVDFFCVLGLGLEPCVLDSTSDPGAAAYRYSNEEVAPLFTCKTAAAASTSKKLENKNDMAFKCGTYW